MIVVVYPAALIFCVGIEGSYKYVVVVVVSFLVALVVVVVAASVLR